MSKTFLAALIFRLVEEGRLSLDDVVAALLPEVRVGKTVTVRMLLDHTSGLADFFFSKGIDKALLANRGATWTAARALGYVGKPYFPPGSGWHYSNTNYLLLQANEAGAQLTDVVNAAIEPFEGRDFCVRFIDCAPS